MAVNGHQLHQQRVEQPFLLFPVTQCSSEVIMPQCLAVTVGIIILAEQLVNLVLKET